jgi:uncharacterized membrane protein YdbT with pleckstrin-like domain
MNYVQTNLLPDEKIVLNAKIHWIVLFNGTGLFFLFLALMIYFKLDHGLYEMTLASISNTPRVEVFSGEVRRQLFALILLLPTFRYLITGVISYFCTEFAVTDKRVMVKLGLIKRDTFELNLDRVTNLNVNQSVLGRFLNYGDITVVGIGGSLAPIRAVVDPLNFRRIVLTEVEGTKIE